MAARPRQAGGRAPGGVGGGTGPRRPRRPRTACPAGEITLHQRKTVGFLAIARTVLATYRKRAVFGLSLFIGQAFLYNAITFGFGAILTKFYDVPTGATGYYFAVIALGNFLGPLLLGKLFDTVGRRRMIASTYLLSGLLLLGCRPGFAERGDPDGLLVRGPLLQPRRARRAPT